VTLVLASASPRRRELVSRLGLRFDVRPVHVVEEAEGGVRADILARRLAREKAEAARLSDPDADIIAADTVVVLDGAVLGKPADSAEARKMLEALRGRWHDVISAVAYLPKGELSPLIRQPVTSVSMRPYADAEVDASIARGDLFDKAGAYAIQDAAFKPVVEYEGCYCNVVGLSLWATVEVMRKAGADLAVSVEQLLPQCADCPLALV
jgi:septum formation protein